MNWIHEFVKQGEDLLLPFIELYLFGLISLLQKNSQSSSFSCLKMCNIIFLPSCETHVSLKKKKLQE